MGIQGLLPLLRSIQQTVHVREFKDQRVAVDGYSWLHRGVYCCASDIIYNRAGSDRYIAFCMHLVGLLKHYGVIPYIVFDGARLPSKAGTEKSRHEERAKQRAKAEEFLKEGKREAAYECFAKAVDITPAMAHRWIKALRAESVEYVVAPYEADAQLAFLCREGLVEAVITEDSDLLAYGCPRVLYKMDKEGTCKEIKIKNLPRAAELNFHGWTPEMFLQLCVLAGCDFLPSLKGMGIKTAHKFMKGVQNVDALMRKIRFAGQFSVPPEYQARFEDAVATFTWHWVFDPRTQRLAHCMREWPPGVGGRPDILGPEVPPEIAQRVARGEVDPMTHEPFPSSPPPEEPRGPPRPQLAGRAAPQPRGPPDWRTKKKEQRPARPQAQVPISSFFEKLPISAAASRAFKPPRPKAPPAPPAPAPPPEFKPIVLDAEEEPEAEGMALDEEAPAEPEGEETSRYFAAPRREPSPPDPSNERTPARPPSPGADPWSFTWDDEAEAGEEGPGPCDSASGGSRPGSSGSGSSSEAGSRSGSTGSGAGSFRPVPEGGGPLKRARSAPAVVPPAAAPPPSSADTVARVDWSSFTFSKKPRPQPPPRHSG